MDRITTIIILFLAIYLLVMIYMTYAPRSILEGFNDGSNQMGFLMMAPTYVPPDATLVNIGTMPTMTVKNHAKINAKYEYDERVDESRINFNVKIPQTLSSTYDLNDETVASYMPYQMKGFCNALNATSDTIEEKCNGLDATTCASTACCVLYDGKRCVAGDERGPTFVRADTKTADKYYYMGNCYGNCSNYIANEYDRIETPSKIDTKVLRELDASYNDAPLYFTDFYQTGATTTPAPVASATTAPFVFKTYATSPPAQYMTVSPDIIGMATTTPAAQTTTPAARTTTPAATYTVTQSTNVSSTPPPSTSNTTSSGGTSGLTGQTTRASSTSNTTSSGGNSGLVR